MAKIDEPEVLLAGQVFSLVLLKDYETKQPNGAKVRVLSGEGITEVKLTNEKLAQLAPITGDHVVWFVKYLAWSMDSGQSGLSTQFVRLADYGDVDRIGSQLKALAGK